MLDAALELKTSLQECVINPRFEQCSSFDASVKQKVLADGFWGHMQDVLTLIQPVYFFLREVDSNSFPIGKAYMKLREIEEGISKSNSNDKAEVMQLYQDRLHGSGRKAGYHSPVHSAAMLLHPPY